MFTFNKPFVLMSAIAAVGVSTYLNVGGAFELASYMFPNKPWGRDLIMLTAMIAEVMTVATWLWKSPLILKLMFSLVCVGFMTVKVAGVMESGNIDDMNNAKAKNEIVAAMHKDMDAYAVIYQQVASRINRDALVKEARENLDTAMGKRTGKNLVWDVTNHCTKHGHPKDCAAIDDAQSKYDSLVAMPALTDADLSAAVAESNKILHNSPALAQVVSGLKRSISDLLGSDRCVGGLCEVAFFDQNVCYLPILQKYVDTNVLDVLTPCNFKPSWGGEVATKIPTGEAYLYYLKDSMSSNSLLLFIILLLLTVIETAKSIALHRIVYLDDPKYKADFYDGNIGDVVGNKFPSSCNSAGGVQRAEKVETKINDLGLLRNQEECARFFSARFAGPWGLLNAVILFAEEQLREATARIKVKGKIRELDYSISFNNEPGEVSNSYKAVVDEVDVAIQEAADNTSKAKLERMMGAAQAKVEQAARMAWISMVDYFKTMTLEEAMQVIRSGEGMSQFNSYTDDERVNVSKAYQLFFHSWKPQMKISTGEIEAIIESVTGKSGRYMAGRTFIPALVSLGFLLKMGAGKKMETCTDEEARAIWASKIKMVVSDEY